MMPKVIKNFAHIFLYLALLAFAALFLLLILRGCGIEVYTGDGGFMTRFVPDMIVLVGWSTILGILFALLSITETALGRILLIVLALVLAAVVLFIGLAIAFATTQMWVLETMESPDGSHTVAAVKSMWLIKEDVDFYEARVIFFKKMTMENGRLEVFSPDYYQIDWTDNGFTLVDNTSGQTYTVVYGD